jgi:hypothetical protein
VLIEPAFGLPVDDEFEPRGCGKHRHESSMVRPRPIRPPRVALLPRQRGAAPATVRAPSGRKSRAVGSRRGRSRRSPQVQGQGPSPSRNPAYYFVSRAFGAIKVRGPTTIHCRLSTFAARQ